LESLNVGFRGEGKTRVPREKTLGTEKRTNNKLNSQYDMRALTTASTLIP